MTMLATLTVARIVDGDTFELSDGTMLRLIGIDTPEVHPSPKLSRDVERSDMDRETIRELGRRASAYAAELALGKSVELEYGSGRRTDRYGRTLAYVWVLDEYGRRLYRVNDRLVADGYANIYSGIPFEYSDEYLEYEREAREEGRGLWGEVEEIYRSEITQCPRGRGNTYETLGCRLDWAICCRIDRLRRSAGKCARVGRKRPRRAGSIVRRDRRG